MRNILDFEKDFPQAKIIKLEQNYRSTKTILSAANDVIKNNSLRSSKTLWTNNYDGGEINLYEAYDENDEANFIVSLIKNKVEAGASFKDFAVLYRANAQSRVIEDALVRRSIPYRLFGGVRFYARKEIKDLIAYLSVINNPLDDISLRRIINVPKRGIGDTTVMKISAYAAEKEIPFFTVLNELDVIPGLSSRNKKLIEFQQMLADFIRCAPDMSIDSLLDKIISSTGYVAELKTENTEDSKNRIANINEFINKAYEYSRNAEDASLSGFLEEIALVADIDNYKENEDAVVLMTLHSSKGLEFPCVFISGVEEGIFPSYKAIYSENKNDMEEERRLCYVGITRAEKELFITHAKVRLFRGAITQNPPSCFIGEISEKYINEIKNSRVKTKTIKKENNYSNKKSKLLSTKTPTLMPSLKREVQKPTISYSLNADLIKPNDNVHLNYSVGDRVRQQRYGIGDITDIKPAGADYELTINFDKVGVKKFMSNLVKLTIVKE